MSLIRWSVPLGQRTDQARQPSPGVGRPGFDPARGQAVAQRLGPFPGGAMDGPVVGEEAPGQPVHQDRPDQALLDQQGIVVEGGVQLVQGPQGLRRFGRFWEVGLTLNF